MMLLLHNVEVGVLVVVVVKEGTITLSCLLSEASSARWSPLLGFFKFFSSHYKSRLGLTPWKTKHLVVAAITKLGVAKIGRRHLLRLCPKFWLQMPKS